MTMAADRPTLFIPDFAGLQPGDVNLSAPVIGDVVQVGWSRDDAALMPKVSLKVHVEGGASAGEPDTVSLSRADGKPLQIAVLGGEIANLATSLVPAEPAEVIMYRRRPDSEKPHQWELVADLSTPARESDVTIPALRIAEAIARFVRPKQS